MANSECHKSQEVASPGTMAFPTILDDESADSQLFDYQASQVEPAQQGELASQLDVSSPTRHPPPGETVLPIPDLPEVQPTSKRQRTSGSDLNPSATPSAFKVKWIATSEGRIPFCMNMDTGLIHCGRCQMTLFTVDGQSTILCAKGCHWDCPGHGRGQCGCHCHILQWHYRTR